MSYTNLCIAISQKKTLIILFNLQVYVVGSFLTQTQARPEIEVDIAVQMPKNLFEDKDRLNHRYFHLRAYYLAMLADGIAKDHHHFTDVQYVHYQVIFIVPL